MITITVSSTRPLEGNSLAATLVADALNLILKINNFSEQTQVLLSCNPEATLQGLNNYEITRLLNGKHFLVRTENDGCGVKIKEWETLLRDCQADKETVKNNILKYCDRLNFILSENQLSDLEKTSTQQLLNNCLFFYKSLG